MENEKVNFQPETSSNVSTFKFFSFFSLLIKMNISSSIYCKSELKM